MKKMNQSWVKLPVGGIVEHIDTGLDVLTWFTNKRQTTKRH